MEPLADILRRAQTARGAGSVAEPEPAAAVCGICGGAGYLRYDVHVEDPHFGELVACECTRRRLEQRRLQALVERSNVGTLRGLTFENWTHKHRDTAPPRLSADNAWRIARAYAEGKAELPWLVIHGAFGTGKTHLAVAIANYRLAEGRPAIFIVVPDLLDHLRATFSPTSDTQYDEQFEAVRNTPLLVLDDLGTQTSSAWATEKLYQILNHRYNQRLDTVITSNLSPDEIEPRLRSRVGDSRMSQLVEVRDQDKRLGTEQSGKPAATSRPAGSKRTIRDDRN